LLEPRTFLLSGEELWYLLYHIPLVNVSQPRKLPDLDGDGVLELLAACAVTLPSEVNDQVGADLIVKYYLSSISLQTQFIYHKNIWSPC
jgi:hypothetical protein